MSESPFVPFYTSDFLGGTSGMTAAAKGVYITLLCLMYEAEAPLPQSWDTLARRCGCTLPAFRRAVASLEDDGKLTVSDAGVWSAKCDKHITQRRERQRSATAAAKKRWEKVEENQRPADAAASPAQCKPEPEPEPEPYIKETAKRDSAPNGALDIPSTHDVAEAVECWNTLAAEHGLPTVQRMTDARKRKLRMRLDEAGGLDGWRYALAQIEKSPFLRGENDRGWRADFDFLLQPKSFTRLMEGAYERSGNARANGGYGSPGWNRDAILRGLAGELGTARTGS